MTQGDPAGRGGLGRSAGCGLYRSARMPDLAGMADATPETRIRRGRSLHAVAWGGVVVLLCVLAWRLSPLASGPHDHTLRIAINPWPGYEFATLAERLGYFEDEGLDVRLVQLSSLSDARRAYERGQVDGFFGTIVELVEARRAGGLSPVPVLVTDCSDGADVIMARDGIGSIEELRGKRIAIEPDTLTVFLLARALQLNGMGMDDIVPVPMAALRMHEAMRGGAIDAAVAYPPVSVVIANEGVGHGLFDSSDLPGEIVDVLAIDQEAVERCDSCADRFRRAFFRAQAYAREHPEVAYAVMSARLGITPGAFAAALNDGVRLVDEDGQSAYLGPHGSLTSVMNNARAVLARANQELDRAPAIEGRRTEAGADD